MDSVNKTLYIPLYGKAYVSRNGLLLRDETAEAIWEKEGFPLKGKAKSKWLAYNMGMRAAVFDRWLEEKQQQGDQHQHGRRDQHRHVGDQVGLVDGPAQKGGQQQIQQKQQIENDF